MFSKMKLLYVCTTVKAYLIVCLYLLRLGVLCLLRMCGVYVRHHLPPLHPRPMAVFRCQHLRMGPVCLAHRLVQVFCRLILSLLAKQTLSPQRMFETAQDIHGCQVSSRVFFFFYSPCLYFHTERGVCLPTVSLWILFVYIEAAIRFKDLKNFHVDLCRPFAAHW